MTRSNGGKSMRIMHLVSTNPVSKRLKAAIVNGLAVRPTDGFIKIAGVPATVELVY